MAGSGSSAEFIANWSLSELPRGEFRQLQPSLEPVALGKGEVLYDIGQRIRYVYFPCAGLVSLLGSINNGRMAEVAVVGKEGMVGVSVLLGHDLAPHRAVVQSPGEALRMRADLFRTKVRPGDSLSALLLRYVEALFVQLSQSAVCNCLHPVHKRYCRWLLLAHDRIASDDLPLTQKFLALSLAVRLASISEAARPLQQAGLIRYSRGHLRILDRPGLEAVCCPCYRVIKERFDGLLH